MSLYDEQIRQRYKYDEEMLKASYEAANRAVTGKSFSLHGNYSETAIGQVLKFFHSPVSCEKNSSDIEKENLELTLSSAGIMTRQVFLYDNWYKSTWGVYLAKKKDSDEIIAVLPKGMKYHYYYDNRTKKDIRLNKDNAEMFDREALCLYRPFPMQSMTMSDMIKFTVSTWSFGDVVYTLLMLLLMTLLGLLTPKISYFMFSKVAELQQVSLLNSTLVFGIFAGVSAGLIGCVYRSMISRIGAKMRSQIESATMMRILTLPLSFIKKYGAGDLAQRVQYIEEFCVQIVDSVLMTGLTSLFSLAYFSQVIVYAPTLALPVACVILVSLSFFVLSAYYQYKVSKIELELDAKNMGMAFDTIIGIEKIKLAGAEKRMFARYGKNFSEVARVAYNPPLIVKLSAPISLAILLVGQFVIYYTALVTNVGRAEYYAFQTAYGSISGGLILLSTVVISAAKLFGYFLMIKPIIETPPENNENLIPVTKMKGAVDLSNITFRYEKGAKDIISGLTLKIRPGEYVAIVGESGCGKSTLVRLLLGFAEPQKGAIYYDGKDIKKLEKSSLRRRIGVVMQNDGLFTGSIYSNITVSVPGASMDLAWQAAEIAGIADDIRKLPMGMHTFIGEGTGGFSGGQRQRLIIARAIAPDPRILIFDEATSALDNKTQREVSEALNALKCTRIIIAHRLSTIRNCNRILFMEKGTIVEEGSYEELIALGGRFAELVERQRIDI